MKTTTKILTIVVVAAVLGAGAFSYKAYAAVAADQTGGGFFLEKLAELGITGTQKQQVRSILREHAPTAGPLIQQLVAARRQLRDDIRADQLDEKAIRAQAAVVAGIEANLAVERAHIVQEIKPVLTSAQIAKLKEMQADGDARFDSFLSRVAKRINED